MKHRVRGGRWISGLPVVLLICLMAACGNPFNRSLTFTITFADGQDLRPGHFVFYHGVRVGEVTSVDLTTSIEVVVTIDRGHEEAMQHGLSFFIEKADLISAERRVVAYDCGAARGAPIERGDVVKGGDGWIAWTTCKAREQLSPLVDQLGTMIESFGSSDIGKQLTQSMRDLTAKASEMGKDQYENLRKQTLPDLREKAMRYKEQLEKDGKLTEAKQFWDRFLAWANEVEKGPAP
jgi:hypothetical protein